MAKCNKAVHGLNDNAMADIVEIRASSWGDLLDCPSRWEAIHVLGMTLPASAPAHLGTSIHYGTAVYDQSKLNNSPISISDAVDAAVQKFQQPDEEVRWTRDDMAIKDALNVAIKGTRAYCSDLSPMYNYSAVELRPEPIEIDLEGIILRLTGQMDRTRIVDEGAGVGINDVKTGRARVNTHGVVNTQGDKFQAGIYEIITEQSTGKPVTRSADILGINTTKQVRTGVGKIYGAKDLMLGTSEQPGVIETAGQMLKQGLLPPNPRSRLCSEKWCPRYHICKAHD